MGMGGMLIAIPKPELYLLAEPDRTLRPNEYCIYKLAAIRRQTRSY